MTLFLFLLVLVLVAALVFVAFFFGFDIGEKSGNVELNRVKVQAAHAEKQLHEITRQAFVGMMEETERLRSQYRGRV